MVVRDAAEPILVPELMDAPDLSLEETEQALADLDRVHRWLFGHHAWRRCLLRLVGGGAAEQTLLDLGSGSGTISRLLRRRAGRRGVQLRVLAVDRKIGHLLFSRRYNGHRFLVAACGEALPFRQASVDWSFSNLLLHHFGAAANRRILREMLRVSRSGVVIVDLRQARVARWLVRLLLPLLRVGRVARYDGCVSADQAWSMRDVESLTRELPVTKLRRHFPFRFSLVLEWPETGGASGQSTDNIE